MKSPQTARVGRVGVLFRIDPSVVDKVRQLAAAGNLQLWCVVQDGLVRGLPQLPAADDALPHFAYDHTQQRGRPAAALFLEIAEATAQAVRSAAAARHAHVWWIAQEALRLGLPPLPVPNPGLAFDGEELPESA
jgi:hypothetical protein